MASLRLLLFRVSDRLRSNGHGEDLFSVEEAGDEIKTLLTVHGMLRLNSKRMVMVLVFRESRHPEYTVCISCLLLFVCKALMYTTCASPKH